MRHRTLAQRDSASRCRAALRPSSITGAPCRTDGASWPRCFLGFFSPLWLEHVVIWQRRKVTGGFSSIKAAFDHLGELNSFNSQGDLTGSFFLHFFSQSSCFH